MAKEYKRVVITKKELIQIIGNYLKDKGEISGSGYIELTINPNRIIIDYESS